MTRIVLEEKRQEAYFWDCATPLKPKGLQIICALLLNTLHPYSCFADALEVAAVYQNQTLNLCLMFK